MACANLMVAFHRCTSIYGTPTMFIDMLNVQRQRKFDLGSVETGIMAGSPCPKELCKNVISEMNMKDFVVEECQNVPHPKEIKFVI